MPVKSRVSRRRAPRDRLPNAPLAEVVFELRWRLQGSPPFFSDPAILPLTSQFTARIGKAGFPIVKETAQPEQIAGHGVTRRYFPSPDVSYPLVQIGPGVFASNQSADYDWKSFKSQTVSALKVLLASFPRVDGIPLVPIHLELRYIDVFDTSLLSTNDLVKFANDGTDLGVKVPAFISGNKRFSGDIQGRIGLHRKLSKPRAIFSLDLATGKRGDEKVFRLETKVVSLGNDVPRLKQREAFTNQVSKWLDDAHNVTSPFFKGFVKPELLEHFGASK